MSFKIGVGLFTGQVPVGSERSFHQEYTEAIELVKEVESQGLDSAWVSEHHFAGDGYLPALLPLLASFAAVTERIELGTGVVLAPFHDPLRLAEDFAVVDQIAGGRVIAGFGIGWRDEEFRAFDIKPSSRVKRTEEIVAILRRAWNEDRFDFQGRYYSYSSVAVTPKPARVPPILLGGFVDEAIRRAGRIGDGYIASRGEPERLKTAFAMAAEARRDAGLEGPPIVAVLQNAYVTESPERDWPMVRDIFRAAMGLFAAVAAAYLVPWYSGADPSRAQTMAFVTWLLGHVFLAINLRSEQQPILHVGVFSNRWMLGWSVATVTFALFVTKVPGVIDVFTTVVLTGGEWALAGGAALAGTFWMEIWKWRRRLRRPPDQRRSR